MPYMSLVIVFWVSYQHKGVHEAHAPDDAVTPTPALDPAKAAAMHIAAPTVASHPGKL